MRPPILNLVGIFLIRMILGFLFSGVGFWGIINSLITTFIPQFGLVSNMWFCWFVTIRLGFSKTKDRLIFYMINGVANPFTWRWDRCRFLMICLSAHSSLIRVRVFWKLILIFQIRFRSEFVTVLFLSIFVRIKGFGTILI